jgi:hypothetical protein
MLESLTILVFFILLKMQESLTILVFFVLLMNARIYRGCAKIETMVRKNA